MSLVDEIRESWRRHNGAALIALQLFQHWAPRAQRVAGMDTAVRLAYRIYLGRTTEEAAAGEYLYRWRLALQAIGDGSRAAATHYAPHTLGQ